MINGLIDKYKNKTKFTKNIELQWELFKTEVREYTIQYCKRKAKKIKIKIKQVKYMYLIINYKKNINHQCKDEIIKENV